MNGFVSGWAAVLMVLAGEAVLACCSGLAFIPTADLVEPGGCCLEMQFDGSLAGEAGARLLNTQFGFHRFEAGVDFDLGDASGARGLFNAKHLLLREPALAIGVHNVCSGLATTPYAVATREIGQTRCHLGCARIEGVGRWFVGIDRAVTKRLTLMADYTSGRESFASVGFAHQFTDRLGVMAAITLPNEGSEEKGFTLHLTMN